MRLAALALVVLVAPARLVAQAPPLVAPTDALSPADERKAFTVPAGFDVQLVASEPDIQKPMQLAFDAKGRLWVTTSYHYPFAVEKGKGTDKVFVLSDFDPETGKARKVSTFTSDLNIPIGILPLPDCKSVLVSSVGEIRKYKITETGAGPKADGFEVLFTGFGSVDTHGMYNSYTLMPDGWVYACHGFRNDSKVKGKDGHEIVMNSGHTFRFRPDGSRIEVYTRGQVNPFGIAVDPWFNLYTADCHSKPITQLIPGAYYDSFGKPHDGLGYGPHVTRHDHGSTGLCGLTWYDADQFPKEYKGTMFLGNVVTSRINLDRIEWKGATPVAREQPDFLVSKDLWFRPVDIKLGPDGALYVSDFYNKIIGHYEVDLKHPGRDKDRGRIWRIVWKGEGAKPAKMAFTDLTTAKPAELTTLFENVSTATKLQILNELVTRIQASPGLFSELAKSSSDNPNHNPDKLAPIIWWGHYWDVPAPDRDQLNPGFVIKAVAERKPGEGDGLAYNLAHGLRLATAVRDWSGDKELLKQIQARLLDTHPHVRRAAVEAVIFHPHSDFVKPLVELLKKIPADDTHLRHAARVALRNCLRDAEGWKALSRLNGPTEVGIAADVIVAIPTAAASKFLVESLRDEPNPPFLLAIAEHVGRWGTQQELAAITKRIYELVLTAENKQDVPMLARGVQMNRALFRGLQASNHKVDSENRHSVHVAAGVYHHNLLAQDNASAKLVVEMLELLPTVTDDSYADALGEKQRGSTSGLVRIVHSTRFTDEVRGMAMDSLARIDANTAAVTLSKVLKDEKTRPGVRERALIALGRVVDEPRDAFDTAITSAPYRVLVAAALNRASTRAGAENLLASVKEGKSPARLLQEKAILEKLRAAKVPDLDKQIAALTKGLPPLDQKIAEVMKKRATAFAKAKPDKEQGAKLFTKHCAACHRIGDAGGKIAPQLDGIGSRGLERILEDVLDPNRNVDQAFRARIISTKDERSITGLMLRVEGESLVLADAEGKELRVPTNDIATNRETMLSPMPANFADAIPEGDFMHLMAYLLDQKAKEPPKK